MHKQKSPLNNIYIIHLQHDIFYWNSCAAKIMVNFVTLTNELVIYNWKQHMMIKFIFIFKDL